MRIGILSDTHDKVSPAQMEAIKKAFSGVDMIFHCGDIYSTYLLDQLEEIAPLKAALGNGDFIQRNERVSLTHDLVLEGYSIHLTHYFPFDEMEHLLSELKRPQDNFSPEFDAMLTQQLRLIQDPPDIIIFGHTHRALVYRNDDVVIINPGSPTVPLQRNWRGSVVLLTLEPGKISPSIIRI
ncbi:MAG: YfcE family phosphodiesterase [Chloroflexi bacterium]|nr:YfcE family phosphodiesterase [Chloroflexota bacterium]